jgi:hypothetical protein
VNTHTVWSQRLIAILMGAEACWCKPVLVMGKQVSAVECRSALAVIRRTECLVKASYPLSILP